MDGTTHKAVPFIFLHIIHLFARFFTDMNGFTNILNDFTYIRTRKKQ